MWKFIDFKDHNAQYYHTETEEVLILPVKCYLDDVTLSRSIERTFEEAEADLRFTRAVSEVSGH